MKRLHSPTRPSSARSRKDAPKILGAGACVAGFWLYACPVHADGTAAGTAISNTAAATYTDPNNPGQMLNATSNTVSVKVAEVAGLTVAPAGATDTAGHTDPLPGDVVNYDYTVTNVGNDPTKVFLPAAATVTGPGTAGALQYKMPGATTFSPVPAGGGASGSISPGQAIVVRVPITIGADAATGQALVVRLGDTAPNDNSAGTQNQPYAADGSNGDVYTVDNPDGSVPGEIAGPPVNGAREASATEQTLIGSQPQAFAVLGLTHTGFTHGVTPASDILTYGLTLNVLATVPSGAAPSLAAADLSPTTVTVGGSPVPRVLVSAAVPAGTALTGVPTAPSGWQVIYTVSPVATLANAAAWTLTPPSDLTTVTRVGWISAAGVAKGASVTGLGFQAITTGASPTASTNVNALAQLFGQTAGDTTNGLVYDESGDAAPSNFNDDGSRGSNAPTTGVASPAADGTDAANNNTGTGPGGEDNVYIVLPDGQVLNGPGGHADAVGPTDNNDDFSNVSALVPAGIAPGSTFAPAPAAFTNTLSNPAGVAVTANILVLPLPPTSLPGGALTDLPTGTTVTLHTGSGPNSVYTYNGTAWTLTSGTPFQVAGLGAGATANYTASVALPAATPLSTDTGKAYSVPLRASIDANGNGAFDAGEPVNTTIDRVYTGFLKLLKEARVVDKDGTTVLQDYSSAPASANIVAGRFVDYRITYTNISMASAGSGNLILSATGLSINEDGTTLPNNWARDNDGNGVVDTSHVPGAASDNGAGATVSFFSGNPATTTTTDSDLAVSRYLDTVSSPIAPGQARAFSFRRRIN